MAGIFGGFDPYSNTYRYGGYGPGNGVGYTTSTPPTTPTVPSYGSMATQPVPQVPTMQPQSFTPQSNIIWVNSEQEINNYPTGRGWQQLFGDKNKNMFYIRETDLNGVTQPIRRLSYTFEDQTQHAPAPVPTQMPQQVSGQPQMQPQQTTAPEVPAGGVSREVFDKLAQAVSLMTDKLADLLK